MEFNGRYASLTTAPDGNFGARIDPIIDAARESSKQWMADKSSNFRLPSDDLYLAWLKALQLEWLNSEKSPHLDLDLVKAAMKCCEQNEADPLEPVTCAHMAVRTKMHFTTFLNRVPMQPLWYAIYQRLS